MNILKRELRAGLKPFLFWMIGMFLLCFVGIIKYQGYSTSGDMTALLDAFPRIALAVMGVVDVDISTLSGYTALLYYYILICAVIYSVHLGAAAVTREAVDKTYDFVFTKPRSRGWILSMKMLSAYIYLMLFCVCNAVFAMMAVTYLKTGGDVTAEIWLCTLMLFLVGALFIAVAAFLATLAKQPEKGTLFGNLAFLYAFLLGVIYNLLAHPGLLRLIAPFNYFSSADLVAGRLEPLYIAVTLALTVVLLWGAFTRFKAKDMV